MKSKEKQLDLDIENAEDSVRHTILSLISYSNSLSKELKEFAENLQEELKSTSGLKLTVNSLGVIQSSGPRIDVLCAKLSGDRHLLRVLKRLKVSNMSGE